MSDEFNFKTSSFWGAVAAFFWALPKLLNWWKERKTQKATIELEKVLNKENSMGKMGINNVKEILEFGFEARSKAKALFDGGFNIFKLGDLLPLYPKAVLAYEGAGECPKELADLDESEAAELVALIISKGVASEEAGRVIGKSLKVGISVIELVKEIKD